MSEFNEGYKEVHFGEYCQKCKHEKVKETEEPCFDCLAEPANLNSHKPVKFDPKEG